MKTNSQQLLSPNIYLGDIDGDNRDEIIEVDGRHMHVFRCQFDHQPLLTHVFPQAIKRLIIGDFVNSGRERGKQQVIGILEDGSMMGYAISNDLKEMWWWFTQPSFIKDDEHYIVGNFDGDAADEIMVYHPKSGSIKLFEKKENDVIREMTNFSLGNLKDHDLKGKLILCGNFQSARRRDDIVVLDKSNGQVKRFDSADESAGVKTFWWASPQKQTGLLKLMM